MDKSHISFAGAGRVATAICRQLYKTGYIIDLVVSRTEKSGKELAGSVSSAWSDQPVFPPTSEVVFVSVPDHSLRDLLGDLICGDKTIVAHTAGSYGLDVFPDRIKYKGVFYPLQTFSPGRVINFHDVPILLESDDETARNILYGIASSMSSDVQFIGVEQRRLIHLAAVFACNFTNHMLTAGYEIVSKAGIKAQILEPLIRETIMKALESGPSESQTGPAFRNDGNTIAKHLELLSSTPGIRALYEYITNSIIAYYKKDQSDKL